MKPRLFIGSSKEGIKYANYLEDKLKEHVECHKWFAEDVFIANRGTLDVLIKQAKLSDFALLIATKDDITTSEHREGTRATVRDNVIFEFGLFLGATSVDRAFLFVQEGADLPSDFNGVSNLTFSEAIASYNHIDKVIDTLLKRVQAAQSQSELGFVPSTALAMGYFTGFIKPVCEALGRERKVVYNDKIYDISSYRMEIILPDDIDDNGVNDFANKYNQTHGLNRASTATLVGSSSRNYPFHFKIDPPEEEEGKPLNIHVSDVPTTLNTILESLKLFFPVGYVGPDEDRQHLEKRELRNFANVLRYYVNRNSWTKRHVEIIENYKF